MPIFKQVTYKVIFDRLYIDAINGRATAYFSEYIDDVKLPGEKIFECGPELVVPLLRSPGDPAHTRGDDIALAVYNLAIQQGWFSGTVV